MATKEQARAAPEAHTNDEVDYRAIVENQTELIWCARPDGTLTFVNHACHRCFDETHQPLVGRNFITLIPPQHRIFVQKQYTTLTPDNPITVYEYPFSLPGGGVRWQQWSGRALFDTQGNLVEIQSVGRDITEQKWMEDALRYRVELERIITGISTHFINLAPSEINQGISEALGTLGAFAGVDRSYVFLFSPQRDRMSNTHEWCAPDVPSHMDAWQNVPLAGFPWLLQQLRRLESICAPDVSELPAQAWAEKEMCQMRGSQALIITPLVSGGRPSGFVGFDMIQQEGLRPALSHIERSVVLLRMISNIFASALERCQAEQTLHQRTAQLEALRQVGLELTAQLNLDMVLRSFVARAVELLKGISGDLHLYHPGQDALERYVVLDHHSPQPGVMLRRGQGLAGQILETGRPLVVDDYRHWEGQTSIYETYPVAAIVGVPMRWGTAGADEEFLGVLDVWSDQPGVFSPADAELLEMFASQAAVVIKNARLVQSLQQSQQALQRQLKELSVLHAAAAAAAEAADEDSLIERATQLIGQALAPDQFGVLLLNEANGLLHPHPSCEGIQEALTIPQGQGITGRVAADGLPRYIPNTNQTSDYFPLGARMQSELCVPLKTGERIIGVINAESTRLAAFSPADERLLMTFAGQLATAIEKIRLFEAERQRRREAESLRELTTALASTLQLDQVLDRLLVYLERVIAYDSAYVFLAKEDHVRAVAGRGAALTQHVLGHDYPADNALLQEILRTGRPIILADAQVGGRFQHWGDTQTVHGWMGVPLTVRGKTIGYLTLASQQCAVYGKAESAMAQAFANQAAVAIENARLYTELQERAQELATALARQEEQDRLKNEFVQNVSHELRTPLSLILGYAEMLNSGGLGELSPEQRDPVAVITRRSRILKKLVEDFITILEAEHGQDKREIVNMAEILSSLEKELRPEADKADVQLMVQVEPDLPGVWGDPVHLLRMADNLIGNALKFTPAGGKVEVYLQANGNTVILEVSDTGVGIPPDKLERVFDRFYQIDGSSRRRYSGVGLGLALVKEIVEAYGGRVSARSEPRQGTNFQVVLPGILPI